MSEPIYVIGHKNPDTDSIVSAIAYAYLKNQIQDKKVIASCCGKINSETAFVLDYFDQEAPLLLEDVRPRAIDLLKEKYPTISPQASLQEAGNIMRQQGIKTLPVVNEKNRLLGILTVGDLANLLLEAWDLGSFPMDEPVGKFMRTNGDLVYFHDNDLVDEIRQTMLETRYRNYPVVDEYDGFLGLISRYNLLALRGKQLILVDHNEKSQAVCGIEQAEVVEIIDHHRIADVETSEPILMRNEPVGSTATIVAKIFQEQNVPIPDTIAGLLCAAILSDTQILKSPTTTAVDEKYASQLAAQAQLDVVKFGKDMFKAGSNMAGRTGRDLLLEDFKEFNFGEHIVGIGQIQVVDGEEIEGKRAELFQALEEMEKEKGYDLVILIITDLMRSGSELLFAGKESRIMEKAFNATLNGNGVSGSSVFLPGVMSRKKQVVPPLSRYFK